MVELWLSEGLDLAAGFVQPGIVNCLSARPRERQVA